MFSTKPLIKWALIVFLTAPVLEVSSTTPGHGDKRGVDRREPKSPLVIGNTQEVWGQCGGIGWTGPTQCAFPNICKILNAYYSQCLPPPTCPTLSCASCPSGQSITTTVPAGGVAQCAVCACATPTPTPTPTVTPTSTLTPTNTATLICPTIDCWGCSTGSVGIHTTIGTNCPQCACVPTATASTTLAKGTGAGAGEASTPVITPPPAYV